MTRPTYIPIMVIITAIALCAGGTARADVHAGIGIAISPHLGLGVWVGRPAPRSVMVPPPHRHVMIGPHGRRFVRLGPPRPTPIMVPAPVIKRIVIPAEPPRPAQPTVITVWITNSNGSQTSVKLTRQGACYIGPRSEYYTTMPTNEQLRMIYGF